MSIYHRLPADKRDHVLLAQRAEPNVASDLLPWADPYIAQLWQQHCQGTAAEASRSRQDRRREAASVIPLRGEAPLPLVETPLPATKTHRRSQRASGLRVAAG